MGRKNIVFIVIAVVLGLLFIGSAVLLFRGIGRFNESERELDGKRRRLNTFYEKKPFPSESNVEQERQNVDTVNQWFDRILSELRASQIPSDVSKSPSQFILVLQRKNEELKALFPGTENLRFGFEQYLTEDMVSPLPGEVLRLTQQLLIVEQIAKVLSDSGVEKLESIERELFEGTKGSSETDSMSGRVTRGRSVGRGDSRSRPGAINNPAAGRIQPGELYGKFHFIIEFEGKEDEMLSVLDSISSHDLFMVVTSFSFERENLSVRTIEEAMIAVSQAEKAKGTTSKELPRAERLLSGQLLEKPMKIKLEVDVYNFAETIEK